jgi:hypothetical protein
MAKRMGGTAAKSGFYWNLGKWELTMIPKQGGILPGGVGERYLRVPVVALLVLAPMMGGIYAFFLPFIGFAMLFSFMAKKAFGFTRAGAEGVAATIGPSWRPGEAYLSAKKPGEKRDEGGGPGPDQGK